MGINSLLVRYTYLSIQGRQPDEHDCDNWAVVQMNVVQLEILNILPCLLIDNTLYMIFNDYNMD